MLIDLLVELLLRFLAEPSKFSVNRERRRQMRQLLKRARTLLQEGQYERARVQLGAALALRPDTKRLVADATQMREELARNRKEETMNIGPEPQQPGGGVPQVYALMYYAALRHSRWDMLRLSYPTIGNDSRGR